LTLISSALPYEIYFFSHIIEHLTIFFFFSSRRRHTRFKCDWSSDVCSFRSLSAELSEMLFSLASRHSRGEGPAACARELVMSSATAAHHTPSSRGSEATIRGVISRVSCLSLAVAEAFGFEVLVTLRVERVVRVARTSGLGSRRRRRRGRSRRGRRGRRRLGRVAMRSRRWAR